jgi:maltokinase
MIEISPAALAEFLRQQRWFAAKDGPFTVADVEVLATVRTDPVVQLWLVHVEQDGVSEPYHLVAELRTEPLSRLGHVVIGDVAGASCYDALHDRDVTDDWLGLLEGSREAQGLTVHRIGGDPLPEVGPSLVMTAEQSNTSLVFGDSLVLKFFRRPHPGVHPDVEVQSALAAVGCTHIAKPYGWIDSAAGTLAFAQEFLAGGVEGWDLAKSSVRDLVREGDLHADEVGGDFAAEAERLGEVTAEVHESMRVALPTDSWTGSDLVARAVRMHDHLAGAVQAAPQLEPYAKALGEVYDDLAGLDGVVTVQRIHGDLHLGQTMRVSSGWKLLDFEGEPARAVAERRDLDSPLRDVAGMLRSFEYAAHQSDSAGETSAQAAYRAAEWAERNRTAFCDGYARAGGYDPRGDEVLLKAYEADKAVYEVVYEARMRPEWLPIPLAAVERLAG